MEILDLYDDKFNKINETIVRGDIPSKGKNIMLSVSFIINKNNEYLIQKTSKEKGSKYSSTGGHVTHNEDALSTIIRELKEELDIDTNSNKIKHITTFKYPNKSLIFNVYLLEIDNINNINYNTKK
ncbi:MAG: NUDIX hydrolase [Bacilli bacterium]|nr:NUDIX hydrolase [Bacilli bacterium]